MESSYTYLVFLEANLGGNQTTVGAVWGRGRGMKSGLVGKCGNARVWAVEKPEGGYAVASRC